MTVQQFCGTHDAEGLLQPCFIRTRSQRRAWQWMVASAGLALELALELELELVRGL